VLSDLNPVIVRKSLARSGGHLLRGEPHYLATLMAPLLGTAAAFLVVLAPHVSALVVGNASGAAKEEGNDCNHVVFDRVDKELHVRTMVVEDSTRQRMLVLAAENDTSMPCRPQWWLDHNPQGVVQCLGSSIDTKDGKASPCDAAQCKADTEHVQLGYVRTMLASAVFVPQPHTMSAICIELGCRSRITRSRVMGSLLEKAPAVQWAPRARVPRMLVIGLGSSTMALWIRQMLPDTELHVAELVPGVAAAASCFGLTSETDKQLHLHVGDGRSVLQESPDGKFDAILVDAFDHDASLPPCFRTAEFFAIARKKLMPGGALSFNLFSDGKSKIRIVKALTMSFDASHIWVGDAPDAKGIQEVVTAFAPGRPAVHLGKDADGPSRGHAQSWWGAAHYRQLRALALHDEKAFEDVTECPDKNTKHHG